MSNKLRLVLDTNVFLVSLLPHHKYWWLFEALLNQQYILLVSNEILTEYLEKCIQKYGVTLTDQQLDFLLELSNVELVTSYYNWQLIEADPDDNKFIDCAVAGQADYIVTHDKHFRVLETIFFPQVSTIRLEALKPLLEII
ncbi:MAG: putative toxin-antitoxin system toxin component, PIN family [Saprospiraceae bacterium]|nr:putative toxin-antitoxin system toxin component, PIN family [Saprospiraceae bacterium]